MIVALMATSLSFVESAQREAAQLFFAYWAATYGLLQERSSR